ncbi:hypothetical protein BH23VER1_BH23VER1_18020 [soil metagenome]
MLLKSDEQLPDGTGSPEFLEGVEDAVIPEIQERGKLRVVLL